MVETGQHRTFERLRKALLAALAACALPATAQQVIPQAAASGVIPPALSDYETQRADNGSLWGGSPTVPQRKPIQAGPLNLWPHAFYRYLNVDGLQSTPGNPVSSVVQTLSPGVLIGYGTHWTLDYTPTWTFYSNPHFRNTLDHTVSLSGGAVYEDWVLRLSQSYSASSAPLVETGAQTGQDTHSTGINASRRLGNAMSLDLGVGQSFRFTEGFSSSREWSTMNWLNYQFWPRLTAGLGLGGGYVNMNDGADMSYEQGQVRIVWRATDKLSLQLHGGVEDRQILRTGSADLLNPLYGVAIQYEPFDTTRVSFTVDRTVTTSLFGSEAAENTRLNAHLNQRLFGHFFLDLGASYNTVSYATGLAVGSTRQDDSYSFDARISCVVWRRVTVAVSGLYSSNSSSATGYGYNSKQFGIELGYQY